MKEVTPRREFLSPLYPVQQQNFVYYILKPDPLKLDPHAGIRYCIWDVLEGRESWRWK